MSEQQSESVIVENNTAHILQIQLTHGENGGLITLIPFSNEVPRAKWEEALKQRQVQIWMNTITDSKEPEVFGRKMLAVADGLPALDALRADRLLRNTVNMELLEKWKADEKRADIAQMIVQRIADLKQIKAEALEEAKAKEAADKGGSPPPSIDNGGEGGGQGGGGAPPAPGAGGGAAGGSRAARHSGQGGGGR